MSPARRTLNDYFESVFVPGNRAKLSAETMKYYRRAVNRFGKFAGDIEIEDINSELLNQFAESIVSQGMANKYVRCVRKVVSHHSPKKLARGVHGKTSSFAPGSLGTYCQQDLETIAFNRLRRFTGKDLNRDELTDEVLGQFRTWCESELKPSTVATYLTAIGTVLRRANPNHVKNEPSETKPSVIRQRKNAEPESLSWLFFEKYLISRPDLTNCTIYHFCQHIRHFDNHLGRQAKLSDLDDEQVSKFLAARANVNSACSVNNTRRHIICLWRYAWSKRLVDDLPRDIPKRRETKRIPDAWTLDEMRQLLEAASAQSGNIGTLREVEAADFFRAYILFAYETGLRLTDLLSITLGEVQSEVRLVNKTQTERRIGLTDSARQAVDKITHGMHADERIFGIWKSRSALFDRWKKIVALAGLQTGQRNGSQKLRRSSASHLESVAPGTAKQHLGHRTPGLAERHYIDPRVVETRPVEELLPRFDRTEDDWRP